MLSCLIVLLPAVTQADVLFDFQMKLAIKGNAEAQFKIGEMYEAGFGVKKDMAAASSWITKAANQGHETATFKLLYWDLEKKGMHKSNQAGVMQIRSKAREGDPQAEYYLGKMYANGVGMKKDSDEALDWLNKATFAGVLEAESEMITVREAIQKETLARDSAEQQRQAEQEAKLKAKPAAPRKSTQKKKVDKNAHAAEAKKSRQDEKTRAKATGEEEKKSVLLAEQQALASKKAKQQRRETEKRALQRSKQEEKGRKEQFESDPCSGKSARFLSTCR